MSISQFLSFERDQVSHVLGVLLGLGVAWLFSVAVYRVWFHPLAGIPGPFLAKLTDFYGGYIASKGINHYHLYELHKKYGVAVRYGPNRVSFNSAKAIRDIYSSTKPLQKSAGYRALLLTGGIPSLFSSIDKIFHGRRRRIIGQGFSEAAMKSYEPIVQERIDRFSDVLIRDADNEGWGRGYDMSRLCAGLTFDVMAALIFGRPFRILEDPKGLSYVIDAIISAGRSVGIFHHLPIFGNNEFFFRVRGLFRLLFLNMQDIRNIKHFLTLSNAMTEERSKTEAARAAGEDIVKAQGTPAKDIFSYILDAKDPETGMHLSYTELWSEARVMIIAGSDTTSTALAGAFYYLSRDREILEKLRKELHAAFATEGEIWPGAKLTACTYLKHVVDEALRMSSPIGGILWRETQTDYIVEGRHLPKGTDVGVPVYATHHNPEYYPDPHTFNPDRWDESVVGAEAVAAAKSAWLPFQTGARSCIGRPLAMMELMLTLARTVYKYDIRVEAGKEEIAETEVVKGVREFKTRDQLTAATVGPFIQFKRREETVQ
ncbi:hypothetical protein TWF696_004847 [Orbilia brochopaga]|uniref:Cytochrome P450 n=1 Tax=Orbilia brochopaga TaxID=3140254 RepID=A0AAV9V5H5_9PEZI